MGKRLRNFNKTIDYYKIRLVYWEILLKNGKV